MRRILSTAVYALGLFSKPSEALCPALARNELRISDYFEKLNSSSISLAPPEPLSRFPEDICVASPSYDKRPEMTDDFIHSRITGNELEKKDGLNIIKYIRKNFPEVSEYVDFVFQYYVGFSLRIVPAKEYTKGTQALSQAMAHINNKAIRIPYRSANILNDETFVLALIHEFRHLSMNLMQQTLLGYASSSVLPYFPPTDTEKSKYLGYLKKGDERVKRLWEKAYGKNKNTVSKSDSKNIEKLKRLAKGTYTKHYNMPEPAAMNKNQFNSLKGAKIFNFRQLNAAAADFGQVKILQHEVQQDGSVKFTFKILDPLRALLWRLMEKNQHIDAFYSPEEHPYEADAYLFNLAPPDILKMLYPEAYHYTRDLYLKAMHRAKPYHPGMEFYANHKDFNLAVFTNVMTQFDSDLSKNLNDFLENSRWLLSQFPVDENLLNAISAGMHKLIKTKHPDAQEAYKMLAQIEELRGNVEAAQSCRKMGLSN